MNLDKLEDAVNAVVKRWQSPNWASEEGSIHTGYLIEVLRDAMREVKEPNEGIKKHHYFVAANAADKYGNVGTVQLSGYTRSRVYTQSAIDEILKDLSETWPHRQSFIIINLIALEE